jgi:hypothetical protein
VASSLSYFQLARKEYLSEIHGLSSYHPTAFNDDPSRMGGYFAIKHISKHLTVLFFFDLSRELRGLVGPIGLLIWVEKEIDPKVEKVLTNLAAV